MTAAPIFGSLPPEFVARGAEARKNNPVSCRGCTACCRGNSVVFLSSEMGDQIEKYGDNVVEMGGSQHQRTALKLKPNGDCIFLGDKGCSIYEDRPYVCRDFDCRRAVANFPKTALNEVVRAGIFSQDIVDAAKERMGSLKQEPWEKLTLEQKRQYLLRLSRPPR